jgi:hypothetical protein
LTREWSALRSDNSGLSTTNTISTGTAFEKKVAKLCTELGFASVIHLGPGGDRGRDLLVETSVKPAPNEWLKLVVECKYRSRSVDRADIDGAVSWAAVHSPDALVVATNSRIGADAFDWLVGTRSTRGFATIIWDGTFLDHAESVLRARRSSAKRNVLIDAVHGDIHHRIRVRG